MFAAPPYLYNRDCDPATAVIVLEGQNEYIRCCATNFTSITWYENTSLTHYQLQPLTPLIDRYECDRVDSNVYLCYTWI